MKFQKRIFVLFDGSTKRNEQKVYDNNEHMMTKKKAKIFGQDPNILMALVANIVSWFVTTFLPPHYLSYLVPAIAQEEQVTATTTTTTTTTSNETNKHIDNNNSSTDDNTCCIVIGQPGGIEQLRTIKLKNGIATCGYNLSNTQDIPFTKNVLTIGDENNIPNDCVVVKVHAFSINYADCCIRWGLYESANEYVGYPIVPGFDIAGVVEHVPFVAAEEASNDKEQQQNQQSFQVGDMVFGCTLFGAYSTRVLVPTIQLRRIPQMNNNNIPNTSPSTKPLLLSMTQAASLPAVSLTSLYALFLAGLYYPSTSTLQQQQQQQQQQPLFHNRSILIHSAAGGVGSMLIQMSKILHLSPIVGIVGHSSKVDAAKMLGCHVVIDKSQFRNNKKQLWEAIHNANTVNNGLYGTVMDCNGVETIQHSYNILAPTGRLIVFGFHTNLPIGTNALSPMNWIRMILAVVQMPSFQPMDMTSSNKSVLGFNLSFFDKERELLAILFEQIMVWYEQKQLECPRIVEMSMEDIVHAHAAIQSGKTVGKIVITTKYHESSK